MKQCVFLLLALLVGGVPAARATSVGFSNDSVLLQDAGGAPVANLTAEIGGFSAGFVPTAQNRDQWMSHWVTAGTGYYASDGAAVEWNAELTASDNTALAAGQALYVWARNATEAGLYGDPAWTMPVASPLGLGVTFGFTANTTAAFGDYDAVAATAKIAALGLAFDLQPASQAVIVGTDVTFTALASGDGTLTYQWSKDGSAVNGATGISFTLSPAQLADAGSYTVTVTNGLLTVTSHAAILQVGDVGEPLITAQPAGFTATAGGAATLTVSATSTVGLTYQWYRNDQVIPGATAATLTFNPLRVSDAGSYTVIVTGDARSVTSEAAVVTVSQAEPKVTWATPGGITYGTALSATQLNATADVAGTFTYTPAKGVKLNAGSQTLSVSFTPADAVNYATSTASVTLTVNQAPTTLTWSAPAAITYGTALSATQLNAAADVAGTFTYTPAAGTILNAGQGQALSVTFTPADAANYEAASGSTTLTVNKASLTAKAKDASRAYGAANPAFEITYTGFVNNDTAAAITAPAASTTATTTSAAGTYPVTLSGGSAANYTLTLEAGTLTVIPASYAGSYFGTFPSGGYWALSLKSDNTGTYIAYLPARHSAVVVNLTVGTDGTFTVTGTELVAAGANPVSALALGNPEAPVPRTAAAAANYTLSGTIAPNGAVSGQLGGLNETFSGTADAGGPAAASAGLYTTSALGTASGATYVVVGASGQALVVTTSASLVDGASGTFANNQVSATSAAGTATALTLDPQTQVLNGTVTPSGGAPTSYSGPAAAAAQPARVLNLSVRSQAGTGSQTLIVGLVIGGSGNKTLLLRGTGPALLKQQVSNALADPALRLLNDRGVELDRNDNWDSSLQAHFTELGAAPFDPNSKDAALYEQLAGGVYSMHVYPAGTGTGVVLAELYDGDAAATAAEVVNISARTQVGVNGDILILGFVITGNTPKTLLIRGVGPTMIPAGVTDALADPQLYLFHENTPIATNDNWGGTTALKNAAVSVGAGPLVSDTSKDAALLITLTPGIYSAQVSGVGGTTGVGLVEIFLIP